MSHLRREFAGTRKCCGFELRTGHHGRAHRLARPQNSSLSPFRVAKDATAGRRSVFLNGATGNATVAVATTRSTASRSFRKPVSRASAARSSRNSSSSSTRSRTTTAPTASPTPRTTSRSAGERDVGHRGVRRTYDDDDKEFVGAIDPKTGLFTPNLDGPNPKRGAQLEQLSATCGSWRRTRRRARATANVGNEADAQGARASHRHRSALHQVP